MYESHFGLASRPFAETTDPAAYIALPTREAVIRRARFAIDHCQGPALLFGPPGAGKSLLARKIASSRQGAVIELTFPLLDPRSFLAFVALELGCSSPISDHGNTSTELLVVKVRETLRTLVERGARPLLLVDDAQLVPAPEGFELLRLLLDLRHAGPPLVDLVLCGTTDVVLKLPASLDDRCGARCLVGALDEDESSLYVNSRLEAAGAAHPLFTREALAVLYRSSDGLPRRINRLADLSLLVAAANQQDIVDADLVALAARDHPRRLTD